MKYGRSVERFSVVIIGLGKEKCPISVYIVKEDAFGSSLNKREQKYCRTKTLPCFTMAASTPWTLNVEEAKYMFHKEPS